MMDIKAYLQSGALEAYVLGIATKEEAVHLMELKKEHPEINSALADLEADLEKIALHFAVPPPPQVFDRISDEIDGLVKAPNPLQLVQPAHNRQENSPPSNPFIEVVADSTHIRVHKAWRWVFAGVFVLGKIFLGCAIYYYLESKQAKQQVEELKTEIKALKGL